MERNRSEQPAADKARTVSDIFAQEQQHLSMTYKTLQKMEKDGYVLRKPDEYDLRATRVFLTEKGREIDDRIRKRIHEEEALAMVDLTESEYETLVKLLTKIKSSILKDSEKDGDLY